MGEICEVPDVDLLPECEFTECSQLFEYDCECGDELEGASPCFEYSEECRRPRLLCDDLPSPCGFVWAEGSGTVEQFEDQDAAVCMLEALRDGGAARFNLFYGEMSDTGGVDMVVFAGGDGTVRIQYDDSCEGCPSSGFFGRIGTLQLQDSTYFDDCLIDPTVESLAACLVGLTEFVPGAPPPDGWTPPFTTGTCIDMEWACPS